MAAMLAMSGGFGRGRGGRGGGGYWPGYYAADYYSVCATPPVATAQGLVCPVGTRLVRDPYTGDVCCVPA